MNREKGGENVLLHLKNNVKDNKQQLGQSFSSTSLRFGYNIETDRVSNAQTKISRASTKCAWASFTKL